MNTASEGGELDLRHVTYYVSRIYKERINAFPTEIGYFSTFRRGHLRDGANHRLGAGTQTRLPLIQDFSFLFNQNHFFCLHKLFCMHSVEVNTAGSW